MGEFVGRKRRMKYCLVMGSILAMNLWHFEDSQVYHFPVLAPMFHKGRWRLHKEFTMATKERK
jgi:hypothetical protein